MTDEVADLVLADNEAQANALEIAVVEAALLVGVHARQIERLEQSADLDRALEALPTPKQLQERHAAGLGLTAPSSRCCSPTRSSSSQRALVASDVPDDPYLARRFVDYFPPELRDRLRAGDGVAPAAARDRRDRRRQHGGEPRRHQLPVAPERRDW